jgi:hypothetical protein
MNQPTCSVLLYGRGVRSNSILTLVSFLIALPPCVPSPPHYRSVVDGEGVIGLYPLVTAAGTDGPIRYQSQTRTVEFNPHYDGPGAPLPSVGVIWGLLTSAVICIEVICWLAGSPGGCMAPVDTVVVRDRSLRRVVRDLSLRSVVRDRSRTTYQPSHHRGWSLLSCINRFIRFGTLLSYTRHQHAGLLGWISQHARTFHLCGRDPSRTYRS